MKESNTLKHFPEFLLKEVVRLKECDAEEELLYTRRGLPEDWVWRNEGLFNGSGDNS